MFKRLLSLGIFALLVSFSQAYTAVESNLESDVFFSICEKEIFSASTKVLQYNMKFGKPGQVCCHQCQGNQRGLISAILTKNAVDLGCLIECQLADDDKSCINWSLAGYAFQFHTCPGTTASYEEAITLVYNTNRYTLKEVWNPQGSLEGCCAAEQKGRGFMAISLTEAGTNKDVIFIGIHSPQNSAPSPFTDSLLEQISDAIEALGGQNAQIILAGDFNYDSHQPGYQANSNDFRDHLSHKFGVNWSNVTNLIQCGTNDSQYGYSETFDNVFTNQTVTSMTCEIPKEYVYQTSKDSYSSDGAVFHFKGNGVYSQLTGAQLGSSQSEEHLPLLVTIIE